jgi:hypothetical protein
MNKQEQLQFARDKFKEILELIEYKGDDYANDDRLSNFKESACLLNTTAFKVCLNQIAIKISRIVNLIDREAKNESLKDSLDDLFTYSLLLSMIHEDEEKDCRNL